MAQVQQKTSPSQGRPSATSDNVAARPASGFRLKLPSILSRAGNSDRPRGPWSRLITGMIVLLVGFEVISVLISFIFSHLPRTTQDALSSPLASKNTFLLGGLTGVELIFFLVIGAFYIALFRFNIIPRDPLISAHVPRRAPPPIARQPTPSTSRPRPEPLAAKPLLPRRPPPPIRKTAKMARPTPNPPRPPQRPKLGNQPPAPVPPPRSRARTTPSTSASRPSSGSSAAAKPSDSERRSSIRRCNMLDELRIGATVHGADHKKIGTLKRIVVERDGAHVTHLVVDPGLIESGQPLRSGRLGRPQPPNHSPMGLVSPRTRRPSPSRATRPPSWRCPSSSARPSKTRHQAASPSTLASW